MRMKRTISFAALAAGLGLAAPAGAQPSLPPSVHGVFKSARQIDAVKYLDVLNVSLRSSALASQALFDLAHGRAYDPAHALALLDTVDEGIARSQGELASLRPLAAGRYAGSSRWIGDTSGRLIAARSWSARARLAIAAGDVDAVRADAAALAREEEAATADFLGLAAEMNYDPQLTAVRAPGPWP